MCWGDIPHQLCEECVANGTQQVASHCWLAKEAIIWYEVCLVRYSNRSFFSSVDEQPKFQAFNTHNASDQTSFAWTLANTLNQVVAEAANSGPAGTKKFATKQAQISEAGTLYTLAQCTPDLSIEDCGRCLHDAITDIAGCCLGKAGGRVVYPSCKLRFELYNFYWNFSILPTPPTPLRLPAGSGLKGKRKIGSQMIVVVVISAVVSVMIFGLGGYFLRKRARKSGILSDGQKIAVKRLSNKSSQGFKEFKNEVLLIAKLQHRNLVALLGFCLDVQEKILVYEYVPNKSLDYFLFDPLKQKQLSWFERHQIIGGVALGILYLHEHSRLKVIHCDLKFSNILLDDNMNLKISDFGMAKTIAIDEVHGRTSRIVGTLGYMSPEYARLGQFSEKSDIFSFGIMILEIITGKRNTSHLLQSGDDLLSYVWKQWSEQTPLEILDSNLKDSYSEAEVIKCTQIGLLCVQEDSNARPSMSTVVSYISSLSAKLPSPQEPAFFIHDKKEPNMVTNNSMPSSRNYMTTSHFFPR